MLFEQFPMAEEPAGNISKLAGKSGSKRKAHLMALPAYDQCIKASHASTCSTPAA